MQSDQVWTPLNRIPLCWTALPGCVLVDSERMYNFPNVLMPPAYRLLFREVAKAKVAAESFVWVSRAYQVRLVI